MSESFAELFEKSVSEVKIYPGALVRGRIVDIGKDYVLVNAGLKSESSIPAFQFHNGRGEIEVGVGDEVDVVVETMEDGFGATILSREKAKRAESWNELVKAHEANVSVMGIITGKVKGGFTVEIKNIRAFLPGSLVDVRPVRDVSYLEGKELDFKVIKLDKKRNNVVVSRRQLVEAESSAERQALLENLTEGVELLGIVKNLTDYGAFVDLGGIDGLLHITDMSWKRIKHPSEIIAVGQEINVKVLKFDRERSRVSLGIKQLGEDPWQNITRRYQVGSRLHGKVTNVTDYGCFVEIENGIEGLVHVSEMDWTNKNIHPSKVVQLGDEIEVMVLEIDEERRRISLGIKQCAVNPWEAFAATHSKNERIKGTIKSITDFGIFVGLDGGIDGLVHLSDVAWNVAGEEAIHDYKKGQEIETVILSIDPDRERISLGIKQLDHDPFTQYAADHAKGTVVKGAITAIDAKGCTVDLDRGVEGYLRISEVAKDHVDDIRSQHKVGDEVEAQIIGMDRKARLVNLSIKAMIVQEESAVIEDLNRAADNMTNTTLGDLLKQQIESPDDSEQ